ncbi:hypothetical protein [Streptomyces sp. N35]|uniref:hypothetical protein n=1 Tax=Streptomyces sp. N35 TaxID=2795730 RepID=UPI0018F3AC2B|nr:hypothetical protein [Streptomyces sp. N35]
MTAADPRPLRMLIRTEDGRLIDPQQGRKEVALTEFRALLQAGERLRVRHETTNVDCTMDLVTDLLATFLQKEGGLLGLLGGGQTK